MQGRGAWAQINLDNLENNIKEIKSKIANGARFCAVVKANAYGHGAVEVAKRALALGADYLAVAIVKEAIELREAKISAPILILGGIKKEEATLVARYGITQAVFTEEMAQALNDAAACFGKVVKVHLVVDTGMGRIGVRPENAGEMAAKISEYPFLKLEGMFSHFALADAVDKTYAKEQFARFQLAMEKVSEKRIDIRIKHIANSAAILEMPETHLDMVRAGIILYGLNPSDEVIDNKLQPVMSVKVCVTYVKELYKGETISYGCTYKADGTRIIATLPLGYADGYSRLYANKAYVLINGKKAPVVGRICMDQCMVDVTGLDEVKVGDVVTVFGEDNLTADTLASQLGTINYEVVCMMAPRLPRVFIGD